MQVSSPKTLHFAHFMVLARVSLLCALTLNDSTTGNWKELQRPLDLTSIYTDIFLQAPGGRAAASAGVSRGYPGSKVSGSLMSLHSKG